MLTKTDNHEKERESWLGWSRFSTGARSDAHMLVETQFARTRRAALSDRSAARCTTPYCVKIASCTRRHERRVSAT